MFAGFKIKQCTWFRQVHRPRKQPEEDQAQRGPGQVGRPPLARSADLPGRPPWPILLWRFTTDLWRSVPPALNVTDLGNRLKVADLPRL
ncbi:hypothetical protein EJB05_01770, partial [Eragrostis curvula]